MCKKSILTPKYFTQKSTIEKIKGMYIPFWLFSFNADANISIDAKEIRKYTRGDTEYTETKSYKIYEAGDGHFDRIPTDALKDMDNLMMDSIEPFDFKEIKPFNPAYLTGFYAQQWDDSSEENLERAKKKKKIAFRQNALENAGNYTTKSIVNDNYSWDKETIEQTMIPVWMMYTKYKGKDFVFGMNGQTGKMMGKIPKDPFRLVGITCGVFLVSQIVMAILRIFGVPI